MGIGKPGQTQGSLPKYKWAGQVQTEGFLDDGLQVG